MKVKKQRIPRKLKKQIPKGVYCYTHISIDPITFNQKIKSCPFYKCVKRSGKPEDKQDEIDKEYPDEWIGWCKLDKWEIDDQCKSCGIKHCY